MTPPPWLVWATLLSAGVAYEVHELRGGSDGYPLSRLVRAATRVDTPAGRAAFTVGWGGFAVWFGAHIVASRPLTPEV